MRNFQVIFDDKPYQTLLTLEPKPEHRETWLTDKALNDTPRNTYILTGNKTEKYGGGPSPFGFVKNSWELLGFTKIEGRVKDNILTIF